MASECSIICYFNTKNLKKISGEGHSPPPSPWWEGLCPSPSQYPLGACGALILVPLALAPVQKF